MLAPTPRQLEVLAYLRDNPSTVPPTRKEIGRRFGISPNAVERHLHALERKGLVRREAGKHRALVVGERVSSSDTLLAVQQATLGSRADKAG